MLMRSRIEIWGASTWVLVGRGGGARTRSPERDFSPRARGRQWRLPPRRTCRCRAGAGEVPTALMATYYAQRASAGLIVSEGTQITPQGQGYPGTPGIHSVEQIAGWKRVTDAVHARGGRIFCQLWHVGRISHPLLQPGGALPVAPSPLVPAGQLWTQEGMRPFLTPRGLETAEISGLVEDYRTA